MVNRKWEFKRAARSTIDPQNESSNKINTKFHSLNTHLYWMYNNSDGMELYESMRHSVNYEVMVDVIIAAVAAVVAVDS